MVRLMFPVAALSSFLNNTAVVALFTGVVKIWSKKLGIAPSKLLIPLSYASGMGGICTLIGTPPNLLLSGFYTKETGIALSIFTPTLVGLFCLVVGVLSVLALSRFIPVRKSPEDALQGTDQVDGQVLVVSQFTLYGNCRKGRRPSFTEAADPQLGNALYEKFLQICEELGYPPQHGQFGADMKVESINDGPVTLILDTDQLMDAPRR